MSTSSWKAYSDDQLRVLGGIFKVLDQLGIKAAHIKRVNVNLNLAVREMNASVQRHMLQATMLDKTLGPPTISGLNEQLRNHEE